MKEDEFLEKVGEKLIQLENNIDSLTDKKNIDDVYYLDDIDNPGGFANSLVASNISMAENMSVPGDLQVGQTMEIKGDIKVDGQLKADEITLDVKKITLNLDEDYIAEVITKMEDWQLEALKKHLQRVNGLVEKEQFGRT